ncbi:MAG TPA: ATP-binding protein [Steroidobacteraceae bacterium]|nr:ATP-binding protein [Steroidobacteraceae bacterium]
MSATAPLKMEQPSPAGPATPPPSREAIAAREVPAALHGRLLNVSRMATIGEMAAGVAHELNQPLTAIANYAHACERLLSHPQAEVAELREALGQITAQTLRAAGILRRLRALARNHLTEHAPASLNALVSELHELVQTDALVHGVQLRLDLAAGLPEVHVDPGQVQQALLNLVRNSLDALGTGPVGGGQIRIRTRLTATGEVELSVSDNGPGVPAEAMTRIFDPFFSTKENGTGLGLAITHSIVRAHGGSMGYRPNVPNGACFYMLLPSQSR